MDHRRDEGRVVPDRRADVDRLAVLELSSALRTYVARMHQSQALVERRLAAAEAAADQATTEARRGLSKAMERLDECRRQDNADLSGCAAAFDRAKVHLESMYSVARDIARLRAQHGPIARRFNTMLEALAQQAQRELMRAGDTLDTYLGTSTGRSGHSGADSGGPSRDPRGPRVGSSLYQPVGFPPGIVMVPLSLIDESESTVHGPSDFRKGVSPADLEWALEKFFSVIVPGVADGATIDDFRVRDQREGRIGTRSYADTYDCFFGGDKILLEPNGATFRVLNGNHRIWVAKNMGLDAAPAEVSGHGVS